jgi:hypothetical protein
MGTQDSVIEPCCGIPLGGGMAGFLIGGLHRQG